MSIWGHFYSDIKMVCEASFTVHNSVLMHCIQFVSINRYIEYFWTLRNFQEVSYTWLFADAVFYIFTDDKGLNNKYDCYDMNFPMHFDIDFNLYMGTFPYKQRCISFSNATKSFFSHSFHKIEWQLLNSFWRRHHMLQTLFNRFS